MNGTRLFLSLLLVAFPALVFPVVRRTGRPKWWTIFLAASLGAGFVLVEASLIHAALPAVFALVGLDELAAACRALGGHLFGATPAFAAFALVVALLSGVKASRGALETLRMHSSLRHGAARAKRTAIGGQETVLMPLASQWAFALPGPSPQIIISDTLVSTLETPELTALVRHEAAHLRHHHFRFLLLSRMVSSGLWFLPWIRRATRSLMLALERWADEEASTDSSEAREQVRSALRKLSRLAPSALAGDRITALEMGADRGDRAVLRWSAAVSSVVPLVLALALTLVHHLLQVIEVATQSIG